MNSTAKALIAASFLALTACDSQGTAEQAGEEIDEAVESLTSESEQIMNDLDDAVDDARDSAEEIADDVEDKVAEATDNM